MAKVFLITGGARSGKSHYAEKIAKTLSEPKVYIATCPVIDDEMRKRVTKHQEQRQQDNWTTIEEQINLVNVIHTNPANSTILVDCLTLWINNLMYQADCCNKDINESDIVTLCSDLHEACNRHNGNIIFVINEVGMGIVPDNAAARRFRDLSGRCAQSIAAFADHVTLVSCGIPLHLK
jgi:adenosylcobinamide kinase/adenosylcobinamide-phosphate guanylyltransferase